MSDDRRQDIAVMNDGCKISYQHHINGDKATLLLSNSLGCNRHMWQPQLAALGEYFNVLTYDSRGHGLSDVAEGAYSIDRLGCDIVALLDHLNLDRVHFCGLSIGGMLGQWLAVHHPERIKRLVLANTAAVIQPVSLWQDRIDTVRDKGLSSIWSGVLPRWLSNRFQEQNPDVVAKMQTMFESIDARGYVGCCAAIRDMDMSNIACLNTLETLIVAGTQDLATPLKHSEYLLSQFRDARLVELDAGHLSNIEQAQAFNEHVLKFLLRPVNGIQNDHE